MRKPQHVVLISEISAEVQPKVFCGFIFGSNESKTMNLYDYANWGLQLSILGAQNTKIAPIL